MVSVSEVTNISNGIGTRTRFLIGFGILLVVGSILSLYLIWKPAVFPSPLALQNSPQSAYISQEVRSWVLNYQDLTQASNRHIAFRELTTILQEHEDAAQGIEKVVLSQPNNNNTGLLAVAVGALSSQDTSEAQRSLCNILLGLGENAEKVMVVLPQIMLLKHPQDFLFDELQAFIHNTRTDILRENTELVLAGLWQRASQTNENLADKITLWLEQKKAELSGEPESLAQFLDLLGNTANPVFLEDILTALTHENAEVRVRAAFALRLFQDERAVSALKHQMLVDQNPQVKSKAADALSYFQRV